MSLILLPEMPGNRRVDGVAMLLLGGLLEIDCGLEIEFLEGFISEKDSRGQYSIIDERRRLMGRGHVARSGLTKSQADKLCAEWNKDSE